MGCCHPNNNLNFNGFNETNLQSMYIFIYSSKFGKIVNSQDFATSFFKTSSHTPINEDNSQITKSGVIPELEIKTGQEIKENTVVEYPRLEMKIENPRSPAEISTIIITPNSINGANKKIGEKFFFGGTGPNKTNPNNDFNFGDDTVNPKQFEISFLPEKNKFILQENPQGSGTFVKIKSKLVINKDYVLSFCSCHMHLQVKQDDKNTSNKIISVKFLVPNNASEKVFNSNTKKEIKIGRSRQADVVCKDVSVSRIQCTLLFENNDWVLYDGFLENGNKGSTNGLWLLASNKLELTDQSTLKTGNTTLEVRLFIEGQHNN